MSSDQAGWIDVTNAGAAWLALLLTGGQLVASAIRKRRETNDATAERIRIETDSLGDEVLHLRVRFDAPSDHTRYFAKVAVVKPAHATLSPPQYVSRSSDLVLVTPGPAWNPRAKQSRSTTLELLNGTPRDIWGEMILMGLENGRGTVRVEVIDQATDKVIASLTRAVTA